MYRHKLLYGKTKAALQIKHNQISNTYLMTLIFGNWVVDIRAYRIAWQPQDQFHYISLIGFNSTNTENGY